MGSRISKHLSFRVGFVLARMCHAARPSPLHRVSVSAVLADCLARRIQQGLCARRYGILFLYKHDLFTGTPKDPEIIYEPIILQSMKPQQELLLTS